MKYRYQRPHPSLTDYIRTVLVLESFAEPDAEQLPLFTNGIPALLCETEKDEKENETIIRLTLYGKSTPEDCWSAIGNRTIIAYFFKPFTVACLFNLSAAKLVKDPVELSTWNPHQINALKTQLIYAQTTTQKVEALDNLLIYQLKQHKKECEMIRLITDEIMYNPTTEILSQVQEKLQINERSFQRLFKKYVGVTPNQYRRICQFQTSFNQLREKNFDKLTDIAYDNGFADQSHFIRSFREFTHTTPNDYLRSGLKEKNE
ncbi:MAG: AraC family transcriptional regulator [Chitinophagaceae bacterium]|nr:AraC family transcriptional regulator [Chitinophagaceae bacterium]